MQLSQPQLTVLQQQGARVVSLRPADDLAAIVEAALFPAAAPVPALFRCVPCYYSTTRRS